MQITLDSTFDKENENVTDLEHRAQKLIEKLAECDEQGEFEHEVEKWLYAYWKKMDLNY